MEILLYQDATLNLNLDGLCKELNRITDDDFHVSVGRTAFELKPGAIKHPVTHRAVSNLLAKDLGHYWKETNS